jgi:hypothetical protein
MKAFVLFIFTCVTCWAQPFRINDIPFLDSTSSLRLGLAGYWQMEEASGLRYDRSKNGNHLNSSNSVGQATGKIGNCATFASASTQFLNIASNATSNVGGISFECTFWVMLTTKVASQAFAGTWENTAQRSWVVDYDLTSDRFVFTVSVDGLQNTTATANALGSPSTNVWYHIDVWHDLATHTTGIKVNGGTSDTAAPSALFKSSAAFRVGSLTVAGVTALSLNGKIDELGLWRRLLTASERVQVYNGGLGVTFPRFQSSVSLFPTSPLLTWGFGNSGTYTLSTVQNTDVITPNGSTPVEGNIFTHRYHHHSRIAHQSSTTFLAFSSGAVNEDAGGQQSVFCWSTNKGTNWSNPIVVVPSQSSFSATNASFANGSRFTAPFAFYTFGTNTYLISVIGQSTGDGNPVSYLALAARQLFNDGSVGTLSRITPESYTPIAGFADIDYDTVNGPEMLEWMKVYGSSGTGSTSWFLTATNGSDVYGEASTISWDGTANNLIRLYRRITSPTTFTWLSTSTNAGSTFNAPVATQIPNSPSYTVALRLSNGKCAVVGNPQDAGTIRDPLFLAIVNLPLFSTESVNAIRQGLSDTPVYSGTYKGGAASYPDLLQVGNYLYVSYSMQKETIGFSRVLIPGLADNNNDL